MPHLFSAWLPLLVAMQLSSTAPSTKQHLLLVLERKAEGFTILSETRVPCPLPKRRSERALPRGTWRVRLTDSKDKTLFERRIADPGLLRAKFHGAQAAVHLSKQTPYVFVLRLPQLQAAHIRLEALKPAESRNPNPPEQAWRELGSLKYPGRRP